MIKASFKAYASYETDSLTQWDINQELVVTGLQLQSEPVVHFANKSMMGAIVKECTLVNGSIKVMIPNSLLQEALPIYAYVGVYDGSSFKVIETVIIPVIARAKPYDYSFIDSDEEIYSFNELKKMVKSYGDNVESLCDDVNNRVESLKKSVSDGKTLVAEAITSKGIPTDNNAEFSTLATNIRDIVVEAAAVQYELTELNCNALMGTNIPYNFGHGSAVVLDNEIHILGCDNYPTRHYKFSNGVWSSVSTLPYNFASGCAAVINDEIHILGGADSTQGVKHYKYDGSTWTKLTDLSEPLIGGSALTVGNDIYVLGAGTEGNKAYKLVGGSTRSNLADIPHNFQCGSAVLLNGVVHILGGVGTGSGITAHLKYEDDNWVTVSTLPRVHYNGGAAAFHDKIRLLGGSGTTTSHKTQYEWDGKEWTKLSDLTQPVLNCAVIDFYNNVFSLGHSSSTLGAKWAMICALGYKRL